MLTYKKGLLLSLLVLVASVFTVSSIAAKGGKIATNSTDCFSFNYPVKIKLGAHTIRTANSEKELDNISMQALGAEKEMDFVYPLSITLEEGGVQTINNNDELERVFESCYGDADEAQFNDASCFDLVFPVTFAIDGKKVGTFRSEQELSAYYDKLDDEQGMALDFVFPIRVLNQVTNKEQTIRSYKELDQLVEACESGSEYEEVEECYTLSFPLKGKTGGSTITLKNEDELINAEFGHEDFKFVYPITATRKRDNKTIIIRSDKDFDRLIKSCQD